MKTDIESQSMYEHILNGGLYNTQQDEPYFSHDGCSICNDGMGNDVYDVKGFASLYDAQHDPDGGYYEFQICHECLCKFTNGKS